MRYDIIIVIDHYLPGRLAGGPVTTIANMTAQLGGRRRMLVATRNTDLDGTVYPLEPGQISRQEEADVLHLLAKDYNPAQIHALMHRYGANTLYLNSFFSPSVIKTLLLRRKQGGLGRMVLAPRGEFSAGALALKSTKKKLYLKLFKWLGLAQQVDMFQASSAMEAADIRRVLGNVPIHIAPDMAAPVQKKEPMTSDEAQLAFISRISPKKNLAGALEIMSQLKCPGVLDIYGPKEDMAYWQKCQALIESLPEHARANYKGTLQHDQISQTLGVYSAFLFPTLGENYGHVIFEALAAGCPVVVSDQTPWQDLEERQVGWVIPLADQQRYRQVVEQILSEPISVRRERALRCMAYARQVADDPAVLEANLALFPPAS